MSAKFWIVGILLMSGLAMAMPACKSAPTPDPDNGVSNASYRQCIAKTESNIASIVSRLKVAKEQDTADARPVHSATWWDSQIQELQVTGDLCHGTLLGSTR